jgi:hypothetical protein
VWKVDGRERKWMLGCGVKNGQEWRRMMRLESGWNCVDVDGREAEVYRRLWIGREDGNENGIV